MTPDSSRDPDHRSYARARREQQIRRRRIVLLVGVVALLILIIALSVGLSGGSDNKTTTTTSARASSATTTTALSNSTFSASLTGANAVPAVTTSVTATVKLTYAVSSSKMTYAITLNKSMTGARNATIYSGAAGTKGTAVYVLYAGPKSGGFKGQLTTGTIDPAKFKGPLAGKTVKDLITLIQSGGAYVSIGSSAHTTEALRGTLEKTTTN